MASNALHSLCFALIIFLHICLLLTCAVRKERVQVLVIFRVPGAQHSVPVIQKMFKNVVWLDLDGVLLVHSQRNTSHSAWGKTGGEWWHLNWPWNVPVGVCQARKVADIPKGANAELWRDTVCSGEHCGQALRALAGRVDEPQAGLRQLTSDNPDTDL